MIPFQPLHDDAPGLLSEHRDGRDRLFLKTPLWQAALKLETDAFLAPTTQL